MNFRFREPVNAWTHFFGATAAVVGLIVLLAFREANPTWVLSVWIYGLSLCAMFLASAIYHAAPASPRVIQTLRKIDHSAIYLLIAGTYTPFCLNAFSGFWRGGLLAIIWGLAALGILVKLFVLHAPRWVTAGVYIVMGWISLLAVREITAALAPITIFWMVTGGVIYTAGAVIYITRWFDIRPNVFGFHEIWHIFVLLGAAAHFAAIYSL